MTRIDIRIDELVLRGVPDRDVAELAERIERHLRALVSTHSPTLGDLRSAAEPAVRPRPHPAPLTVEGLAGMVATQIWAAACGAPDAPPRGGS